MSVPPTTGSPVASAVVPAAVSAPPPPVSAAAVVASPSPLPPQAASSAPAAVSDTPNTADRWKNCRRLIRRAAYSSSSLSTRSGSSYLAMPPPLPRASKFRGTYTHLRRQRSPSVRENRSSVRENRFSASIFSPGAARSQGFAGGPVDPRSTRTGAVRVTRLRGWSPSMIRSNESTAVVDISSNGM